MIKIYLQEYWVRIECSPQCCILQPRFHGTLGKIYLTMMDIGELKMNLKWLWILWYKNELMQFCIFDTNHTIYFHFYFILLFFTHSYERNWKLKRNWRSTSKLILFVNDSFNAWTWQFTIESWFDNLDITV